MMNWTSCRETKSQAVHQRFPQLFHSRDYDADDPSSFALNKPNFTYGDVFIVHEQIVEIDHDAEQSFEAEWSGDGFFLRSQALAWRWHVIRPRYFWRWIQWLSRHAELGFSFYGAAAGWDGLIDVMNWLFRGDDPDDEENNAGWYGTRRSIARGRISCLFQIVHKN